MTEEEEEGEKDVLERGVVNDPGLGCLPLTGPETFGEESVQISSRSTRLVFTCLGDGNVTLAADADDPVS